MKQGLNPEHGKKEMVRAVLESISFSVKAIVERAEEQIEYVTSTKEIRLIIWFVDMLSFK